MGGARITFNTCKAEEDRDDATLDASFLFADSQEEECPSPNLPLCEPSPRRFTNSPFIESLSPVGVVAEEISHLPRSRWSSCLHHPCNRFYNHHQKEATFWDSPCSEKLKLEQLKNQGKVP